MNHGAEFYALIAHYLPDWKARRALLRGSGKSAPEDGLSSGVLFAGG